MRDRTEQILRGKTNAQLSAERQDESNVVAERVVQWTIPAIKGQPAKNCDATRLAKTGMRCKLATNVIQAAVLFCAYVSVSYAQTPINVDILFIEQKIERAPVLSNLVSWPEDEGLRGAELAINDNNTTGKFLDQNYALTTLVFEPDHAPDDALASIQQALANGQRLVVLNLPASLMLSVADLPEAQDDLLINAQASDNVLRQADCRANVLHSIPSRAMLTDALAQFFNYRKWRDVFLIEGNRESDKALGASMRGSLKKFGLKIVEDKSWIEDADMRRNASKEVPVFTQARRYDVVVVTDEDQDFSQYILYNTWLPRPVAGSAGLMPVVWSPVIEQWGAAQLQSRFTKLAERDMTSRDYANWSAVRSIGEAVTRTASIQATQIRDYIMSEEFELAGFKGAPLSFRRWNGQLRQPVQLVHANAVVVSAPVEGFLHPVTELDTLGVDEAETECMQFEP